jgi:hypothetical protein
MVGVYQIDVMFMWGILFILYGHGLIGSGVLLGKKKKKKTQTSCSSQFILCLEGPCGELELL